MQGAQLGVGGRAGAGFASFNPARAGHQSPSWAQCLTRTGNRRQRAFSLPRPRPPLLIEVVVLFVGQGEVPSSMTDSCQLLQRSLELLGPTTVAVVVTPPKGDGERREPSEEAPAAPPN